MAQLRILVSNPDHFWLWHLFYATFLTALTPLRTKDRKVYSATVEKRDTLRGGEEVGERGMCITPRGLTSFGNIGGYKNK
ncbi:hypothetical protein GDO78_021641 [Eleutherodactylus coqui]|uniref:Uncharacterized protein n=1 Tax=Eleutherodactylus coqui TaxID=57060 RepID=A0A8J6AZW1_ELECQ|nr:hypothetical protein GDO78_021641 [Eleutherodactylus coqui]